MKQAKQYFDSNEAVNALYFTSDNLAFFDEQNAVNHAKSLDDGTITTMTRDEADSEINEIINDDPGEGFEYDPLDQLDAE